MEKSRLELAKENAKAAHNMSRSSQDLDDCPPPLPPTPSKSKSANPRIDNIFASRNDATLMDSIAEKLTKLKENNPFKRIKKVLKFDDSVNTVGPGFRCGICEKTFMQRHDCRIHRLSVCIPSQGIQRNVKKRSGLSDTPGSPVNVHPTDPVKHTGQPDPSII